MVDARDINALGLYVLSHFYDSKHIFKDWIKSVYYKWYKRSFLYKLEIILDLITPKLNFCHEEKKKIGVMESKRK